MKASPEFREFGRRFIQDIDRIAANENDLYNFVLNAIEGRSRFRLCVFIDNVLRECSDDELLRLWNSVDSDIYFPTARELRTMLMGARERLR